MRVVNMELVKSEEPKVEVLEPVKTGRTRADQLSPEKHKCIEMMIEGYPQKEIAVEIGVTQETISRWKRQSTFVREYNRQSKAVNATGMALLRSHFVDACQKIIQLTFAPDGDRLQLEAAKTLIKIVKDEELLENFNERLEKMEKMANREA
jgi:transcriptional regulator with XRE-family HTH domain